MKQNISSLFERMRQSLTHRSLALVVAIVLTMGLTGLAVINNINNGPKAVGPGPSASQPPITNSPISNTPTPTSSSSSNPNNTTLTVVPVLGSYYVNDHIDVDIKLNCSGPATITRALVSMSYTTNLTFLNYSANGSAFETEEIAPNANSSSGFEFKRSSSTPQCGQNMQILHFSFKATTPGNAQIFISQSKSFITINNTPTNPNNVIGGAYTISNVKTVTLTPPPSNPTTPTPTPTSGIPTANPPAQVIVAATPPPTVITVQPENPNSFKVIIVSVYATQADISVETTISTKVTLDYRSASETNYGHKQSDNKATKNRSFKLTGLTPNTKYYFRLINSTGVTEEHDFTTQTLLVVPTSLPVAISGNTSTPVSNISPPSSPVGCDNSQTQCLNSSITEVAKKKHSWLWWLLLLIPLLVFIIWRRKKQVDTNESDETIEENPTTVVEEPEIELPPQTAIPPVAQEPIAAMSTMETVHIPSVQSSPPEPHIPAESPQIVPPPVVPSDVAPPIITLEESPPQPTNLQ